MTDEELKLLDHFAGLAMQSYLQSESLLEGSGIISNMTEEASLQETVSLLAYVQAKTMIEFRRKVHEEEAKNKNPQ